MAHKASGIDYSTPQPTSDIGREFLADLIKLGVNPDLARVGIIAVEEEMVSLTRRHITGERQIERHPLDL